MNIRTKNSISASEFDNSSFSCSAAKTMKAFSAIILLLIEHGLLMEDAEFRRLAQVTGVPDIVSFPYTVHLVDCQFKSPGDGTSSPTSITSYNCFYFCSAPLSAPFLVITGTDCIQRTLTPFSLEAIPSDLPAFDVAAGTTDSDESIRFKLTGGGLIYVCKCTGLPCTDGANLVIFGQVFSSTSVSVSSKSHYCSTCTAKKPIFTISAAGKSGGIILYNGLSSLGATVSVPGSNDFTRPTGMVVNMIPYDRPIATGSEATLEKSSNFHEAKPSAIFQTAMIQACRTYTSMSSQIVTSFQQSQFLARPQCTDPVNGASVQGACLKDPYVAFTGTNNNQALIVNQAGTLILCECGSLTGSLECETARSWTFAGLLTVAGPLGGQSWSIPVGSVFGLAVNGWGLGLKGSDHDYLRIISASSKCTDQNNKPDSVGFIKKGCPNCLSGIVTDMQLLAMRSADDVSVPKISKIRIFRDRTLVTFTGDISTFLVTGDRIVVSGDDLVIDGFARENWRRIDQFRAFRLAGRGRFGDELDACYVNGVTDCDDHLTGHFVTVIDTITVSIPVGMDEFESVSVSVVAGGADWERHGRASTTVDLKAIAEATSAIVCWGRKVSDGTIQYFMEAGRVTFYKPNTMSFAEVIPSTRLEGVVQPVTLSFIPNYRRDTLYTSLALTNTVGMKITLLDTSKLDIAPVSSIDPQSLAGTTSLDGAFAGTNSSSICGRLFSEFSLNHNDGFPQPVSCMYSPQFLDQGVSTRELWVYFTYSDSGLRGLKAICTEGSTRTPCQFFMSFHGKLGAALATGNSLVRIEMTCPYCVTADDPYYIIESMTVSSAFSVTTQPVGNFKTALTVLSPSFSALSYTYSAAADKDAVVTWSAPTGASTVTIKFALTRTTGGGITSGSTIHILLTPQLTFSLAESTCTASSAAVGGTITCSLVSLVKKSVIKLVLPTLASPISSPIGGSGDTVYSAIFTVTIPAAGLPAGGILPNRMAAQVLANGDDLSTVYGYTTSTSFVKISETSVFNTGRIVAAGHTGDGLRPFVAQRDNMAQVQLRMARTVIGTGSWVTLHLPSGYECGGPGWTMIAWRNVCQYMLAEGEMMNGGSWVVFNISTCNPQTAMWKSDPTNVWKIEAASPGPGRSSLVTSDAAPFVSPTNRAVIPSFVYAAIQPSSTVLRADQRVSIFLKVSYQLFSGYKLIVVAPLGFVFANPCASVTLLPDSFYYQFASAESLALLADGDLVCGVSPLRSDLNSAVITVTRFIDAPAIIGFSLGVRNPATLPSDSSWYLYVLDADGNAVEGSLDPVEYDGLMDISPLGGSWTVAPALFAEPVTAAPVSGQFLIPLGRTGLPNIIRVASIRVATSVTSVDLTLMLPEGYEIVPGTFSSETIATSPEFPSLTKMIFRSLTLANTNTYSFTIAVRVPSTGNFHALNQGYLELANSSDGIVQGSTPVSIAAIAQVTGASALLKSHVANISTVVTFRFTTVNPVEEVVISGDASTAYFRYNPYTFWFNAESSNFTSSAAVEVTPSLSGPIVIKIRPVALASLPGGTYSLDFNVTNPETPTESDSVWTISTQADYGQPVTTARINHLITSAGITSISDGRPGKASILKFYIGAAQGPDLSHPASLAIYGPPRFIFNDDCWGDVSGITVSSCRGSRVDNSFTRSSLRMQVTSFGDISDGFANITVNVVRNPLTRPPTSLNYWQIQLNGQESSLNFDSYIINEITEFGLTFAYEGFASASAAFPVRARFKSATTLPVSNTGPLVIRADPLGTLQGVLNYTLSSAVRIAAPSGFTWDARDWNDFRSLTPELATKEIYEIGTDIYVNRTANEITVVFIGTKTVEADTLYQLTSNLVNPASAPASHTWTITSYQPRDLAPVDGASLTNNIPKYPPGSSLAVNVTAASTAVPASSTITAWVNFSFPVTLPLTNAASPITIEAPIGFYFQDYVTGACIPQSELVGASALCPAERAPNELTIQLTSALDANTVKSLVVSVKTPDVMSASGTSNYWKSSVTLNGVTQSASAPSFRVLGPLSKPSLTASGTAQGAATMSALTLSFMPTYEANAIHLNVSSPIGFNFSSATIPALASYSINPRMTSASCWNCIGLTGLKLTPGIVTNVTINSVQLGQVGGDTKFSVQTFYIPSGSGVVYPLRVPLVFRDAIAESTGFFLPGKLTVVSSTIRSVSVAADAVILNPLVDSTSLATLVLGYSLSPFSLKTATGRLDQPVTVRLEINCPSAEYEIVPSWSSFTVTPSLGTLTKVPTMVQTSIVVAEWATLMVAFKEAQQYTVTLPVIPKAAVDASNWRIEVFLNDTLLETNDGLTSVPSVTTSIPVDSLTGRINLGPTNTSDSIPPNTDAAITVRLLSSMPLGSTCIAIFAPSGYVFTGVSESCTSSVCPQLVADMPNKLVLRPLTAGEPFQATASVDLLLHTPSGYVEADPWTVVSYDALNRVTGWGTVEPVAVRPMRGVSLLYGGMSGVDDQLFMFSFKIERPNSVNSIELVPPIGISLMCYGQQILENFACTADSSLTGGLLLNCTETDPYLAVGSYSIPLLVSLPLQNAAVNKFDIVGRNFASLVTDGIYDVSGRAIVDSDMLSVREPAVSYSTTVPGEKSKVMLSFRMTKPVTAVDAINIHFPSDYFHEITYPSIQVLCVNRRFPRASPTDWVDASSTQSITFLVDNTVTAIIDQSTGDPLQLNKIPAPETYIFEFPVVLPETTPVTGNYWTLSFCPNRTRIAHCIEETGTEAIAQFPILGLDLLTTGTAGSRGSDPATSGASIAGVAWVWILIIIFLNSY